MGYPAADGVIDKVDPDPVVVIPLDPETVTTPPEGRAVPVFPFN
jgi:hypothetical protein